MGKRLRFQKGDVVNGSVYVSEVNKLLSQWVCRYCNNVFISNIYNINNGHTKSCGCLTSKVTAERNFTHGLAKHPVYGIWGSMIQRCYNYQRDSWPYYGGRGITVCDEWRGDFKAFYDYVTKLENYGREGYTLDRRDSDGNYKPGNVRWADGHTQAVNRLMIPSTSHHYIGVTKNRNRWHARIGVKGKIINLGCYATQVKGVIARDKFIIKHELWEYSLQYLNRDGSCQQ